MCIVLIIERKNGQTVDIEFDGQLLATIGVQVRRDGKAVRLLFEAPPEVQILRPEYRARLAREQQGSTIATQATGA